MGAAVTDRLRQNLVDSRPELNKLIRRLESNQPLLMAWRRDIAGCSDELSSAIAARFNAWTYHGEYGKPLVDAVQLKKVLEKVVPGPLRRDPFAYFAGRAQGVNHFYSLATGGQVRQFTNFTHWDRSVRRRDGSWIQYITVSETEYFSPEATPPAAHHKLDLIVNRYQPETGVTSWAALRRFVRVDSAFIYYEIAPERALWISKVIPDEGAPSDRIFNISFEWWTQTGPRRRRYSMLAMNFDLDFGQCRFAVAGDTCNEIRYREHVHFSEHELQEPDAVGLPGWNDLFRMTLTVCALPVVAATALVKATSLAAPRARVSERNSIYDPEYENLIGRIEEVKPLLAQWRAGFAACSKGPIPEAITRFLKRHRDLGSFPTAPVNTDVLRLVLNSGARGLVPFQPDDFDKTQGLWEGTFGDYHPQTGALVRNATAHSLWYKGAPARGGFVQKVVGSESFPLDRPVLPQLEETKVDIFVNYYRADIGIVGWSSLYQHGKWVQPVIGYKLDDDVVIWFSQLMSDNLEPLPNQERTFFISLEWSRCEAGKSRFCLVLFTMEIDFRTNGSRISGDTFRKGYFEKQSL